MLNSMYRTCNHSTPWWIYVNFSMSPNLLCGCVIMLEETSFTSCYKLIKMVLLKVVYEHCHALWLNHATGHGHVCFASQRSCPVTSISWTYWNRVVSEGINWAVENRQSIRIMHCGWRGDIMSMSSNKPLHAYNRAVFAYGSWTFPLITSPQFGLGYITLGAIITKTYLWYLQSFVD